jgi:IclR family acetate operon transcriptional repressor
MAIKTNQSGSRILVVLEKIAQHQPVGVSELARLLNADKSAVQRAIVTLATDGWIRATLGKPTRWELTARIHSVAQHAHGGHDLRQRARAALEALRSETGESVVLSVLSGGKFIVIDVLESSHYLRAAPPIGLIVPSKGSATSRAILSYMTRDEQIEVLGEPPDAAMLEDFAATVARGYSISKGEVDKGSINIAAPIFEIDGRPIAAVLISAPSDRTTEDDYTRLGTMVSGVARRLSRGVASQLSSSASDQEIG